MDPTDNLKLIINNLRNSRSKPDVIEMLKEVVKLLPPSDDIAISIGKKGTHEYVIDRNGLSVITTSQDEYLPFLSASEKRLSFDQLPDDVAKKVAQNFQDVLVQLREVLKTYSRRNPKYEAVALEVENIVKSQ
ncbi:hypothetical protein GWK48_04090 [Metallosphaera tengchongensis]|uniref:Uncharacterized protein n=1 Tax=Metallosphaera tengchongensis TaxID=1532350 RepID=A0A6N0NX48_9CREN|nr:hypothetical protein [Metallosphaera tengchongensis]QKQ99680.1 hypothetical protein GWK48_04090 [Metallosphaera tengchongensis]